MNKYRSKINPVSIIVNLVLYIVLLVLVYFKTLSFFPFVLVIVGILIVCDVIKYLSYKYYFEENELLIIHKRQKYFIPYKKIKYIEINSSQQGMIYGYGFKRLLVATGRGIDESYLITPMNEKEFIEILENKVKNAKKDTK